MKQRMLIEGFVVVLHVSNCKSCNSHHPYILSVSFRKRYVVFVTVKRTAMSLKLVHRIPFYVYLYANVHHATGKLWF